MNAAEFIAKKKNTWSELEGLLADSRRANSETLNRLGYLYRRVTSDLAVARRDFPNDRCVLYLNELASRAHAKVYQTTPLKRGTIRLFFTSGFPMLFRRNLGLIAIAFLLFSIAFGGAYWFALITPGAAEQIVSEETAAHIRELGEDPWNATPTESRNLFASFVMTNNIRVAFLAFAGGILFMVGTVYILVFNGFLIGAVAGLCHVYGAALPLWSFVSPHGYIELITIFIAGGAGLKIGYALIAPTLFTRKRALTDAAKVAIQLIGGCVVLLIIAGLIEGFVSPSSLPPFVKIGFGAITCVCLFAYLFHRSPVGSRDDML